VIISGLARVESYQALGLEYISVECIDLRSLYLGTQTLENLGNRFLNTELGAIGLRIEQLILTEAWCLGTTVEGRKEDYIAKILGFTSRDTYRRIKKICLQGNPALIEAVNEQRIPIKTGAKIAELPISQQIIPVPLKQKKGKRTFCQTRIVSTGNLSFFQ
jgi:hypothetical protein